jgi:hypothetical protein
MCVKTLFCCLAPGQVLLMDTAAGFVIVFETLASALRICYLETGLSVCVGL